MSHRIQAVLLDIDDTLVDFQASAAKGLASLLPSGAGRPGLSEQWHLLTERHYPRFLSGEVSFQRMQVERLTELLTWAEQQVPDDAGLAALEQRRQQVMSASYELFPDVERCLGRLSGYRVGAVSNSDGPHQRAKLAAVGLQDAFEVVVISGDVGFAKPDPRIFRAACDALHLVPAAVAYVGDRFDVDAAAARDAGLLGVWLNRRNAPTPLGAARIPIIGSLDELPGVLG